VILDTDIHSDVDDVGALALLHVLADRDETEIVATVADTDSRWATTCLSALNSACGRPDVPVGGRHPVTDAVFARDYARYVSEQFPGGLIDGAEAHAAVDVYRSVLGARRAADVTIVSVGALTNLAELLDSVPDQSSASAGGALIARSVRELVVMGGTYPEGAANDFNFLLDADAAHSVLDRWPTPIVFVGFEVGEPVRTGGPFVADPSYDGAVAEAYRRYLQDTPDRPSWDLIAVYVAVRGEDALLRRNSDAGTSSFAEGAHRWQADGGTHRYVVSAARSEEVARALNDLLIESAGARSKEHAAT